MDSVYKKRDRLLEVIGEANGVKSVGVCRKDGELALLVLVEPSFDQLDFSEFEGMRIVVEPVPDGNAHDKIY